MTFRGPQVEAASPVSPCNSDVLNLINLFCPFFENDQTVRRRQLKVVINELMTRENHRQTFHHLMSIALEIYEGRWHHFLSINEVNAATWNAVHTTLDQFHMDWLFQLDVQSRLLIPASNLDEYHKNFVQFKLDLINQRAARHQVLNAINQGSRVAASPSQGGDVAFQNTRQAEVCRWGNTSCSYIPLQERMEGNRVLLQLADMVGSTQVADEKKSLYTDRDAEQMRSMEFDIQEVQGIKSICFTSVAAGCV